MTSPGTYLHAEPDMHRWLDELETAMIAE